MMLYHLREASGARRRLREARRFLRSIDTPDAREMLARPDDVLFHDDLAPVNDPVWFRDFVARAARHGLQFLGRRIADKRADIWSFGGVLYEILTGRQLFAGATLSDTLAAAAALCLSRGEGIDCSRATLARPIGQERFLVKG
jgi:hypothetical protein